MTLLRLARDLLYFLSDIPYAVADGLDMAIDQLTPADSSHVTITRLYEDSDA